MIYIELIATDANPKVSPVTKTGKLFSQFGIVPQAKSKGLLRARLKHLPVNDSKRLLLSLLSNFYTPDQSAANIFPSTAWLADKSDLSQRYVRKCLRDLESDGWLVIQDAYAKYSGKKNSRLTSSRYYFPDTIYLYNPYVVEQSKDYLEALSRIQEMKPRSTVLMGKGKNYLTIKGDARESMRVKTAAFRSPLSSTKQYGVAQVSSDTTGSDFGSQEEEINKIVFKNSSNSKNLTANSYEVAIELDDLFDEFDKIHALETPRQDRLRFSRNFCVKGFYDNRTEFYKILSHTVATIKQNPLLKRISNGHTEHSLGRLFSAEFILKADFGQKCEAKKLMSRLTGQNLEKAKEILAEKLGLPLEDIKRWFKDETSAQVINTITKPVPQPSFIVSEPPSHFHNIRDRNLYDIC